MIGTYGLVDFHLVLFVGDIGHTGLVLSAVGGHEMRKLLGGIAGLWYDNLISASRNSDCP